MEEVNCATCGAPMKDGEPHCSACKASMTCEEGTCACACGNTVEAAEAKCDACLGM